MNLPARKSDLEGFALFPNLKGTQYDLSIAMTTADKHIILTAGTMKSLGNAEAVNVFFDEAGKRMMLRKTEKTNMNAYSIKDKRVTGSAAVANILAIAGIQKEPKTRVRFEGYCPVGNCVIFDLSKAEKLVNNRGRQK